MDIKIQSNAQEVLGKVEGFTPAMQQGIAAKLDTVNQQTIGLAQQKRLSGPRPKILGVVTNRLRGSLNAAPARASADKVVSSIGSNVAYAGIHERGFDGVVPVRSYTRRQKSNDVHTGTGLEMSLKSGRIRKAPTKLVAQGIVTVRAHKMHMKMPARPYLAPTIKDQETAYSAGVSEAVLLAWNGGRA